MVYFVAADPTTSFQESNSHKNESEKINLRNDEPIHISEPIPEAANHICRMHGMNREG